MTNICMGMGGVRMIYVKRVHAVHAAARDSSFLIYPALYPQYVLYFSFYPSSSFLLCPASSLLSLSSFSQGTLGS